MKTQIPSQWNEKVMIPVRHKAFRSAAKLMGKTDIKVEEIVTREKFFKMVA